MKSLFQSIACFLSFAAFFTAPLHAQKKVAPTKDIVDTAVSAGSFKTLAAALEAAGLVDTLKGEGPFTVFAPTDEAFAKLPKGTVESLLKPENKTKLIDILTNHVVSGEISLSKALEAGEAKTLLGPKVNIRFEDGSIKIGDATIATADIKTTNGVIHVIDSVLLPTLSEKKAASPKKRKSLSDLTVKELTELLKVIDIQVETK